MSPRPRTAALALVTFLSACATGQEGPPASGGTQLDLVFERYSRLAGDDELARRVLSPLTFQAVKRRLEETGQALRDRAVDLSKERFSVYLPAGDPPAAGYGLMVYVAPWAQATRPRRWRRPLDRHGIVFVSAEGSGNDVDILARRLPLALLALENVRARYPIDPARVYVGGFSGGSRVALVAALAYPDLFRGVLLNAGSDPIDGERGIYIPPRELFQEFQRTRLVYATGGKDERNLEDDAVSRASMKSRCVLDIEVLVAPRLGHQPLDPGSLARALAALDRPSELDADALGRCNARLEQEIATRLGEAAAAIERGDREGARGRLEVIDARYGGLAAPAILELEARRVALP